jgi:hypothetical protein
MFSVSAFKAFIHKLSYVKPINACIRCRRILYKKDLHKAKRSNVIVRYKHVDTLHYSFEDENENERNMMYLYASEDREIPLQIRNLPNYYYFNKISLCNMYCSALNTTRFSYLHLYRTFRTYKKTLEDLIRTSKYMYILISPVITKIELN